MTDDVLIYGMTLLQVKQLKTWWLAQGKTIEDLNYEKPQVKISVNPLSDLGVLKNGPLVMDTERREVTYHGKSVSLSKKQMSVLEFFMC